ncbi:MAG TPA: 50S ribosomal protein L15 [Candidatus Limnocylindrales bacterium]|nr:50S ribosomal protein L15 [Candidatus Limnocylindrales bacterium]
MKLHDLRPAAGSRIERNRVGRGIAAGKGKTAGRGTKGQKARAGGTIPAWFEGGQTPLHQRIPKLRGFRNRGKVEYEVVNVGRIAELVEAGRIPTETAGGRSKKAAPVTVNQEVLRAAGLVRTLARPLKILGEGDVDRALFVVADAFTKSAREKIEAAGGTAQLLEVPATPLAAVTGAPVAAPEGAPEPAPTGTGASEPAVAEPAVAAEPPADDAEAKAEAAQVEGATEEVAEAAADDDAETGA